MEIWQLAVLTCAGVASGFMNVMAGGGSLLTVPIMLFMGIPGPVANGTNRIAILAQNFTAVLTFFKKGYSDFRLSLSLALAAVPGAIIGALIGTELQGVWFDRIIALVMVVVMILMATEKKPVAKESSEEVSVSPKRLVLGHLCMFGAGLWGGFIQIGVGFILMPILHRVLGLSLVQVNMHKVFIVLMYTIAALAIFAAKIELLWMVGLCLAIGNSIGGWLGATVTISKGDETIRRVFNAVLIVFIIKLLFF
ncbi:MAG: sulfite exporter TauE/SafE family protein [Pseudomonadales bacterium]